MSVQLINVDMIVDTVPKLSVLELMRIRSVIDHFIADEMLMPEAENKRPSPTLEELWAKLPAGIGDLTDEDFERLREKDAIERYNL